MPELSRTPRPRGPRAFTLIELLVAITVIAILVAMLVPSVLAAVKEAERVACMSNLHQGVVAMAVYAEYNGSFLPTTQPPSSNFRGFWAYLLGEYLGKEGGTDGSAAPDQSIAKGFGNHYMRCPSQELELPRYATVDIVGGQSYGAHWGQGGGTDRAPMYAHRSYSVTKLDDIFVIADCDGSMDFFSPTEANWNRDPTDPLSWWAGVSEDPEYWIHNDTYNFGYMDGSVRNIPRQWFVDHRGFVPGTIPQSPP